MWNPGVAGRIEAAILSLLADEGGLVVPTYQFRLLNDDGTLHLQRIDTCADDNDAMRIADIIRVAERGRRHRLKVWRSDVCIYDSRKNVEPFPSPNRTKAPKRPRRIPDPGGAA